LTNRLAAGIVLVALAIAPAQAKRRDLPPGTGTANPSVLIATEIAFARMAREKGQWTAFREFSDEDAVMFEPQAVRAQDWLARQKSPAAPVQWQPYQVWMSCDGTVGVTKGAWQQPGGTTGYYTTVWKRQKKGVYRWVLDQGDTLAEPLAAPDMLSASVADCAPRGSAAVPVDASGAPIVVKPSRDAGAQGGGRSDDGTLTWSYTTAPDNARTVVVSIRKGEQMKQVLLAEVPGGKR
jgi:hypothetical protein